MESDGQSRITGRNNTTSRGSNKKPRMEAGELTSRLHAVVYRQASKRASLKIEDQIWNKISNEVLSIINDEIVVHILGTIRKPGL